MSMVMMGECRGWAAGYSTDGSGTQQLRACPAGTVVGEHGSCTDCPAGTFSAEVDGVAFMVRERAPFRDDIDLDDLSGKQWKKYARICGRSLAQAHALSDEAGLVDHDIEPEILASIGPRELFVDDIISFADDAAQRVREDHEHFRADHELGAFRFIDRVFR